MVSKQNEQRTNYNSSEALHLSPVLMEMAKRELEEFEARTDEEFLIRIEMDNKLISL